jgi:TFIIF-interacting CTD phosphatase-like protein
LNLIRPNTQKFLKKLNQKYELHIYTMGTRPYALEVAKILDPDDKYFKGRILSRDDSGSNVSLTKVLCTKVFKDCSRVINQWLSPLMIEQTSGTGQRT